MRKEKENWKILKGESIQITLIASQVEEPSGPVESEGRKVSEHGGGVEKK